MYVASAHSIPLTPPTSPTNNGGEKDNKDFGAKYLKIKDRSKYLREFFFGANIHNLILTPPTSPTNNGGERKITKILEQKIWSIFFWIKSS